MKGVRCRVQCASKHVNVQESSSVGKYANDFKKVSFLISGVKNISKSNKYYKNNQYSRLMLIC